MFECERKKGGKVNQSKRVAAFFRVANGFVFLVFHSFLLFSLNHFPPNHPSGARVVAQLVIGVVRMSIVAGSILGRSSFLPKIARAII